MRLGALPQAESLQGENMREHAEQHQKDGHGHHDHVMADTAREQNREHVINRVSAEWGGGAVAKGRKSVCLAPLCHLLMGLSGGEGMRGDWTCFFQLPCADVQPAPVVLHQEEEVLRAERKGEPKLLRAGRGARKLSN